MEQLIIDQEMVDVYEEEVEQIVSALGREGALVTDLSQVFDFDPDDIAMVELNALMGRAVAGREHLWMLAEELAARGCGRPVLH